MEGVIIIYHGGKFVSDVITKTKQNNMGGKEKNQRLPFQEKENKHHGKDKKGRYTPRAPAHNKKSEGDKDIAK